MAASREDLGGSKVRLHIEVPADTFKESIEIAYRKERGKYPVQGFRKGHVPRPVIETHYGDEVFYRKALDELLEKAVTDALTETNTYFSGWVPETLTVQDWARDRGVTFEVEVWSSPEVTLGSLEGLQARRSVFTFDDDLVDSFIESMRLENERWIHKDDSAEWGDRVLADFVGSLDGIPIPGGSAEDAAIILGRSGFIGTFEEQLKGAKAGDDVHVRARFPEDYRVVDLAGKVADFDVHVKEVFRHEVPEADDDFAADISEYDTFEELREHIKNNMQGDYNKQAEGNIEQVLLNQITERSQVILPPPMIDKETDGEVRDLVRDLMWRGMSLNDYLAAAHVTEDQMRAMARKKVETQLEEQFVLGALIDKFELRPNADNTDDYLAKAAQDAAQSVEEFTAKLTDSQRESIAMQVAAALAFRKLKDMADITEVADEVAGERWQQKLTQQKESYKTRDEKPIEQLEVETTLQPETETGANTDSEAEAGANAQLGTDTQPEAQAEADMSQELEVEAQADTQEEAQSFAQAVEDGQDVAQAMVEAVEESGGQLPGDESKSEPATDA